MIVTHYRFRGANFGDNNCLQTLGAAQEVISTRNLFFCARGLFVKGVVWASLLDELGCRDSLEVLASRKAESDAPGTSGRPGQGAGSGPASVESPLPQIYGRGRGWSR